MSKRKNSGSAINASAKPSGLSFSDGGSEAVRDNWQMGNPIPEITESIREAAKRFTGYPQAQRIVLTDERTLAYLACELIREHEERQLPVDAAWLLSLGCTMVPCNVHGTPDTDFRHPSGLQFWELNNGRGVVEWCCVDPQVEGFKTRGDVLDLLRMTGGAE